MEWLESVGIPPGAAVSRHPRLLTCALDALQQRHAFLTGEWGRSAEELATFPQAPTRPIGTSLPLDGSLAPAHLPLHAWQALTYSIGYLRKRRFFLKERGARERPLHRTLRTADHLFAKMAGAEAAEYQQYDGGADADGDEPPAPPPARPDFELWPEEQGAVSALDKHIAGRQEQLRRDAEREERVRRMRDVVAEFTRGEGEGEEAAAALR